MKSRRKPLTPIQKSARGENCSLRIPGFCNGNSETVVLCHAPYPGKSGSRKDDWWAAYGCSGCHSHMDIDAYPFPEVNWLPAIHETQAKLIEKGLIIIPAKRIGMAGLNY